MFVFIDIRIILSKKLLVSIPTKSDIDECEIINISTTLFD